MRVAGIFILIIALVLSAWAACVEFYGAYRYSRDVQSMWELADKASTIPQKSLYVDRFVEVLEEGGLKGLYNAVVFKTPNNSFDSNFEALKSLQLRLREIQSMDVKSFEYQTAIQQITAQEQGEAQKMLSVFEGIWWKGNYPLLWNWIAVILYLLLIALWITGFAFILQDSF